MAWVGVVAVGTGMGAVTVCSAVAAGTLLALVVATVVGAQVG